MGLKNAINFRNKKLFLLHRLNCCEFNIYCVHRNLIYYIPWVSIRSLDPFWEKYPTEKVSKAGVT